MSQSAFRPLSRVPLRTPLRTPRRRLLPALCTLLLAAASAQAAVPEVKVGGFGQHFYKVCSTCPDQGSTAQASGGGNGATSAAIASPTGAPYVWAATASLAGANTLPLLGAYAEALVPGTVGYVSSSASAQGLQGYEYIGAIDGRYTIEFTLDGLISGDFENAEAGITVYGAGYDPLAEFNPSLAAGRVSATAGAPTPTVFTRTASVSFDVAAGETFYVAAFLFANAFWSDAGSLAGAVDASHTLSARFTAGDTALLASLGAAPVPEPPSVVLALIGSALLGGWRLNRRAGPARR